MALYIQLSLILFVWVRVRIIQRQLMHGAHVIQETIVIATAVYSINCNMYSAAFKAQRMWTIYSGNCHACRCQCCHTIYWSYEHWQEVCIPYIATNGEQTVCAVRKQMPIPWCLSQARSKSGRGGPVWSMQEIRNNMNSFSWEQSFTKGMVQMCVIHNNTHIIQHM